MKRARKGPAFWLMNSGGKRQTLTKRSISFKIRIRRTIGGKGGVKKNTPTHVS